MPIKKPEPYLNTPEEEHNKVEVFKRESDYAVGALPQEVSDTSVDDIGEAAEQLAKSHGVYLEYNRAKTGKEKDWMYMVRVTVPGGGAFTAEQWTVFDELSNKYCGHNPDKSVSNSIRLTTRQNLQYHWLKKPELMKLVQEIAQTGFYALNGCGDNVRNVMGCPLSRYSDVYNSFDLAHQYGAYFRVPASSHIQVFAVDPNFIADPEVQYKYGKQLLNRKFKIAFSAAHRNEATGELELDNCTEIKTNDLGIAPYVQDNQVVGHQVYIGGGQGEKNGKPTFATHAQPVGIFTDDNLMAGLKAIVDTHSDWGDRKNRHWARLKYVVNKQGIEWWQNELRERGAEFENPNTSYDIGPRQMHFGWSNLPTTGKLAFGAYIENGRLIDGPNGQLKSMVRETLEAYPGVEVLITANQDLLFVNIEPDAKDDFEAKLKSYGQGQRNGKPVSTLRVLSGACVGLPTCRLSYTDSEQFEPELLDKMEDLGFGDTQESIGITGCERQCFRPGTKTFGWVGQGPNMYGLKLGGSECGRHQGQWLVGLDKDSEKNPDEPVWFCRQVMRDDVPTVMAVLLEWHKAEKQGSNGSSEDVGSFLRRMGAQAIIDYLKADSRTAHVMKKTAKAGYEPAGGLHPAGVS